MNRCFVIQPFDGGDYDSRFDDVVKPAIERAGLEAYRVDRDPKASIPIEQIEKQIRESAACVADITGDNPNVWFELGYAIASARPVCLICNKTRDRFPFDVHHRAIIRYGTGSSRDFDQMGSRITDRLKALLEEEARLEFIGQPTTRPVGDLAPHELAALVVIASNIYTGEGGASAYDIAQGVGKAGYNQLAANLAIRDLLKRDFVQPQRREGEYNTEYTVYVPTDIGLDTLMRVPNLQMRKVPRKDTPPLGEDDIPF